MNRQWWFMLIRRAGPSIMNCALLIGFLAALSIDKWPEFSWLAETVIVSVTIVAMTVYFAIRCGSVDVSTHDRHEAENVPDNVVITAGVHAPSASDSVVQTTEPPKNTPQHAVEDQGEAHLVRSRAAATNRMELQSLVRRLEEKPRFLDVNHIFCVVPPIPLSASRTPSLGASNYNRAGIGNATVTAGTTLEEAGGSDRRYNKF